MGTKDEPARGAGPALPEAVPELQAGAGATAAPAQQPQQLPLPAGAQNTGGTRAWPAPESFRQPLQHGSVWGQFQQHGRC